MPTQIVSSWGNVIRAEHQVFSLASRYDSFPDINGVPSVLPHGNGRSYGDSCLNTGAGLLMTRSLDRFISFDRDSGIVCCEAGVLLADILKLAVPSGWLVPVTPGTCFVTVGGAIANDVHGKNHHLGGTFSAHVRRLELLRSDGSRMLCSATENPEWFAATAGGLGLTGVITWAELQLRRIAGPAMDVETIRFQNLDEFLALCAESDRVYEYTVAWVDVHGSGQNLGRGIFQRANHSPDPAAPSNRHSRHLSVPFMPPISFVNAASTHLFNMAYYRRVPRGCTRTRANFASFFYPLDGVLHWNRMYGPKGMYQYQCVVPTAAGRDGTKALLEAIARSGLGSFLSVLKVFGATASLGMLSFPREGVTIAIDFPNRGERLERLFRELDSIVSSAGGRLYPAKDGRMPGSLFRSGYPRWREFSQFIDRRCSSSFWRRVTEHP
jgi:FAD/FMN-containing dehydrogenase